MGFINSEKFACYLVEMADADDANLPKYMFALSVLDKYVEENNSCWYIDGDEYVCSNCGEMHDEPTEFCPYCGAMMKNGGAEDDWWQGEEV